MVKVVNRWREDNKNPEHGGRDRVHGGSSSFALEASRSLASASILLKLRSRTGLINTLEKKINPFSLNEENNRDEDKAPTCRRPLRGILPGPRVRHFP